MIGLSEKANSTNINAIEPNSHNKESLENLGISVLGDFYDTRPYDLSSNGIILMSHVLEHFYSPKEVLKKLYKETNDSVKVIILVPSIRNYKNYMPLHTYWFRMVHLFYFSFETIGNLLKITGWRIIKSYDENGELAIVAEKSSLDYKKIDNFYNQTYDDYEKYKKKINYPKYYFKAIINKLKVIVKRFFYVSK